MEPYQGDHTRLTFCRQEMRAHAKAAVLWYKQSGVRGSPCNIMQSALTVCQVHAADGSAEFGKTAHDCFSRT